MKKRRENKDAIKIQLFSRKFISAHRSGGPLMDIVIEDANGRNGFLAVHDKEYAAVISYILGMSPDGRQAIRDRARASVDRFSDHDFEMAWIRATESLINQCF